MKKKVMLIMLALGLVMLLAACGQDEQTESASASSASETSSAPAEDADAGDTSGTLVAMFSWASNTTLPEDVDMTTSATLNKSSAGVVGDTQLMAQTAAEATGGDYFEILCETPYPSDEDATYEQAKQEQLDQARPALATQVDNMDDYSTIVLVYPNWWGGLPMPVCSFLEAYDFSKKTIIPVCCYEAEDSGAGTSRDEIAKLCDAYVTAGYNLRGNAAATSGTRTDFMNWLNDLPVNY